MTLPLQIINNIFDYIPNRKCTTCNCNLPKTSSDNFCSLFCSLIFILGRNEISIIYFLISAVFVFLIGFRIILNTLLVIFMSFFIIINLLIFFNKPS